MHKNIIVDARFGTQELNQAFKQIAEAKKFDR
jgi:hypothetical protein